MPNSARRPAYRVTAAVQNLYYFVLHSVTVNVQMLYHLRLPPVESNGKKKKLSEFHFIAATPEALCMHHYSTFEIWRIGYIFLRFV